MSEFSYSPAVTLTCSFLFIPACTGVLILRFFARRKQGLKWGYDDWFILPAWAFTMSLQVVMIVDFALKRIGFPDPYPLDGPQGARPNLGYWPFEVLDILALGFTKISVLLFFRRLFGRHSKWLRIASMVLLALCTAWTVAFFFAWIFICGGTPNKYWQSAKIEKASCVHTQILHDVFAASDVLLDMAVVATPIPSLWALSMSKKKKLLVTAIFSLAAVTLLASIARLVIMIESVRDRYKPNIDYEYLVTGAIYWSMIEAGIGFIAANLIVIHGSFTKQWYHKIKHYSSEFVGLFYSHGSSRSSLNSEEPTVEQNAKKAVVANVTLVNPSDEMIEPKKAPLYRKQGKNDVTLDDSFCADLER